MGQDSNDRTVVEKVDPLLGATVGGRFRIESRIAAGGFGAIYRATHVQSNSTFALKVLHKRMTSDRGAVARFQREGATLTTLRSPYTIAAYEIGESVEHGVLFIVMELLAGVSLYERFRSSGPIPWRTMAKIGAQICGSLGEAHALGVVHRDLKPTNIHLEPVGDDPDHVKVLDFGIAKILQDSSFDSSDLTNAGQMIGTLDYMSPEQMVGGAVTGQTDIYTLGIVLYEMVSGKRPFAEAASAAAVLAAMLKTVPVPLTRVPGIPAAFDRIVQRMLAKDAHDRYPDVDAVGRDLAAVQHIATPEDNDSTRRLMLMDLSGISGEMTVANASMSKLGAQQSGEHTRIEQPSPELLRGDLARADFSSRELTRADATRAEMLRASMQTDRATPRITPSVADGDETTGVEHRPSGEHTTVMVEEPGNGRGLIPSALTTLPGTPMPDRPHNSSAASPHGRQHHVGPPSPASMSRFDATEEDEQTVAVGSRNPLLRRADPGMPRTPLPTAPPTVSTGARSSPVVPPARYSPPAGHSPTRAPHHGYDPMAQADRDAQMNRFAWFAVLVVAALFGIIVASRC